MVHGNVRGRGQGMGAAPVWWARRNGGEYSGWPQGGKGSFLWGVRKTLPGWVCYNKKDVWEKAGGRWYCHGWRARSWRPMMIYLIKGTKHLFSFERALGSMGCKTCPDKLILFGFLFIIILSLTAMEKAERKQQEECKQKLFLNGSYG